MYYETHDVSGSNRDQLSARVDYHSETGIISSLLRCYVMLWRYVICYVIGIGHFCSYFRRLGGSVAECSCHVTGGSQIQTYASRYRVATL